MSERPDIRLVIFGDIHGRWDDADDRFYADAQADLFLWTGDLGPQSFIHDLCKRLCALGPHVYGVLGNHDGASTPHVIAEALGRNLVCRAFAPAHRDRVRALTSALGEAHIGFAVRNLDHLKLSLVGMRPHSTGGPRHHFPTTLKEVYGCDDPITMHRRSIDAARHQDLIFLGHNGPLGLGAHPTSPFGIDFKAGGGDLGDPDYADALNYATAKGHRVLLAVGGHMHDRLHRKSRHLGQRSLTGRLGQTPVINACAVPRIRGKGDGAPHLHTEVHISRRRGELSAHRVTWLPKGGVSERQELAVFPLEPTSSKLVPTLTPPQGGLH